jgi:uncharacterized protein involved in exopolysaccharide biosynthesis
MLSIGMALLLPARYTAQARVVHPSSQKNPESMAALGQLTSLAGLPGDPSQNQAELCAGILNSRSVADAIIDLFQLRQAWRERSQDEARTTLANRTNIGIAKSGIVSIEVVDTDPRRAAAMANAYVRELNDGMVRIRSADAAEHRAFFEKQSQEARAALAEAESALRLVEESTGVVEIGAQAQQTLIEQTNLQAKLTSREAEASSMATFMTKDNVQIQAVQREITTLRDQLHRLNATGLEESPGFGQLPQKGLAYLQAQREIKYREALYEFTLKQLENARLDEASSTDAVQIIDAAVVPDRRSSPKRGLIVLLGTFTGLLIGVLVVFVSESFRRCTLDLSRRALLQSIFKELRA